MSFSDSGRPPRDRGYLDAVSALQKLAPKGIELGLDRVREALAFFGNPQDTMPCIHVAGTNGKGSVCAMIEQGLREQSVRTGLYTSPHLHRFAERIRINGEPAKEKTIGKALKEVLSAMERKQVPPLTYFEVATVAAWLVFREEKVGRVVLETGLGGRLDATSVCRPVACGITRIALDHEAWLGSTIEEIAREKAGILKQGVPCVVGPSLELGAARRVLDREAARAGAVLLPPAMVQPLYVDQDSRWTVRVHKNTSYYAYKLGLSGSHQAENAAVAIALLRELGVDEDCIGKGLERVRWPGRLELIDRVLFDGAHNPDGARALREALERRQVMPSAMVFGVSSDKRWKEMLELLGPLFPPAKRFYCAAGLQRAENPERLVEEAPGIACESVKEALQSARAAAGPGLVLVCGSLFVVAEARALLLEIEEDPRVGL